MKVAFVNCSRVVLFNFHNGNNIDGQTSSGKTHTLGGAEMTEGVIPFALQDIFARRKELQTMGTKVDIELSYIEIYREECFDLLSANGDRAKLELKETSTGKTALDGVTCQPVQDIESVMDFLREGAKVRSTGQTAMNAHSSRSHSICTLNLRVVRATTGAVTSQLHLVDLAGSERAKKTQATGDAFQEGISINRGLLALGNVVSALASRSARGNVGAGGGADNGHIHVPYRESKLTRLLKDALGGNGMTVMLACVSPAETNFEETLNTLRFASRASAIVNSVRVNHSVGDTTDTAALLKEIQELRDQVTLLQCDKTVNAAKSGATTASAAAGSKSISNATAAASAEATSKDLAEYHYMVSAALHITTALKTVLVTCLQEGSYVIDSDLLNIQAELQHIRKGLNLPVKASATLMTKPTTSATFANVNTSSAVVKAENKNGGTATAAEATAADDAAVVIELDMDAMLQLPPIMTVIEEVRLLEKDLKALEKSTRGGGYSPQQQLGSSGAQSSTQQHAQGRGGGGGGAAAAVNALRMSLSSDWSAEDSMISCIEDNGGGDGCSANNSFEESFDCIAQDCDAHMQEGSGASAVSAFDVDCSFNDLDNIYMGDAIAEFMASQAQQGAGAAAVTKGMI